MLTNDINLINKSLVSNTNACDFITFRKNLSNLVTSSKKTTAAADDANPFNSIVSSKRIQNYEANLDKFIEGLVIYAKLQLNNKSQANQ